MDNAQWTGLAESGAGKSIKQILTQKNLSIYFQYSLSLRPRNRRPRYRRLSLPTETDFGYLANETFFTTKELINLLRILIIYINTTRPPYRRPRYRRLSLLTGKGDILIFSNKTCFTTKAKEQMLRILIIHQDLATGGKRVVRTPPVTRQFGAKLKCITKVNSKTSI